MNNTIYAKLFRYMDEKAIGLIDSLESDAPYVKFKMKEDRAYDNVIVYGDGFVGGKSAGLLFLTDLKMKEKSFLSKIHSDLIKIPKSFLLRTSFYDEFIYLNNLYKRVTKKCSGKISPEELNIDFLEAELPDSLMEALQDIIARAGELPLVVRSSSLLEDNLRYSFAGIYQSVFITNRGTKSERLNEIIDAVKTVYASTFKENAREYRIRNEIGWAEEKMAILIQEVIGRSHRNSLYYPLISGVLFSQNYYPWSDRIMQNQGFVRMVYGLGTQAVGRSRAKVFSPFFPDISPVGPSLEDIVHYSQIDFDAIDLKKKSFVTVPIKEGGHYDSNIRLVASKIKEDYLTEIISFLRKNEQMVLTFNKILSEKKPMDLTTLLQDIVNNIEKITGIPVDIEFAVELSKGNRIQSNPGFYIVQLRPLWVRSEHRVINIPSSIDSKVIIKSNGIMGNGKFTDINCIIFVPNEVFNLTNAYEIAREVGKVNSSLNGRRCILIGPGRWGTTHPELGIPVRYGEISNAIMIVEVSTDQVTPELSYGTHFFGDLVSSNTIYAPISPEKGDFIDRQYLDSFKSEIDTKFVKLIETEKLTIFADGKNRKAIVTI